MLGLPAPTGVRISQAFDVDAARQPPFDCCLDQLGSEKRKRKREINLTYRAALAFCQLLRIVDCAGHDFVEPASASRDGADQANASFGALGSDMFADGSVRQQDFFGIALKEAFAMRSTRPRAPRNRSLALR